MSSNHEGKKKVHFSTAVSKRGVSDLRNDRKDHTIPLFPHYADNVEFYLESVLKKKKWYIPLIFGMEKIGTHRIL